MMRAITPTFMHPIQTKILRVLLFTPAARFSELNRAGISSDHFNFHVKRLCESGYVVKGEGGDYSGG